MYELAQAVCVTINCLFWTWGDRAPRVFADWGLGSSDCTFNDLHLGRAKRRSPCGDIELATIRVRSLQHANVYSLPTRCTFVGFLNGRTVQEFDSCILF
jgi:hypothetical protein